MKIIWNRASRLLLVVFGILGAFVTVADVYEWWAERDGTDIIWTAADYPILKRLRNYQAELSLDGRQLGGEDITETVVTIWRDGGIPITSDMTRRPLTIELPSGSQLVMFKVLNVESAVENNFQIVQRNDTIGISWKVFDPDMAIRVSLVRSGSAEPISLTQEVGPGISATTSRYSLIKAIVLVAVLFVSVILLAAITIVVFSAPFMVFDRLNARPKFLRWPAVGAAFLTSLAVIVFAFFAAAWSQNWIAEAIVAPIPFQ